MTERRAQYRAALKSLHTRHFAPFAPHAWVHAVIEGGDMCLSWPAPTGAGPLDGGPLPTVPVPIANGDLDVNTPLASARRLGHAFPRARVVEVPNIGHTPEMDRGVQRIYRRLLRTQQPGSTACLRRIPPPTVG